ETKARREGSELAGQRTDRLAALEAQPSRPPAPASVLVAPGLFGIYSTGPLHFLPVNLDLYWLSADNAGVTINGTSGRERRQTLGARTWGKIGQTNLDFEIEGAGQFGTVGRRDVAAGMFTTNLGYTLPIPRLSPRVYLEFDYASGDGRPGGTVGTFNQLCPTATSFLGY